MINFDIPHLIGLFVKQTAFPTFVPSNTVKKNVRKNFPKAVALNAHLFSKAMLMVMGSNLTCRGLKMFSIPRVEYLCTCHTLYTHKNVHLAK